MKIEVRFDHAAVPAGAPSLVHILLTVTAPALASKKSRPKLNLAAVIDRSGSMGGQKLEYAKEAVCTLVDQLGPHDRFSLVAFDTTVLPIVEGQRTRDKIDIKQSVRQLEAGGNTNLSGGWLKGIELVERHRQKDSVNSVLILTDGQANVGIVDAGELVSLGSSVSREKGTRTSCLGLGQDFNEDLLKGIAVGSGGRFHYIESPDHAPEVFREELGGLLAVAAQNVELKLAFADGVTGVAQLTGHPWRTSDEGCHIILGDFHAEQVKHVLLVAQLPALTDLSDTLIASLTMTYAELKAGSIDIKSQKQALVVRVTDPSAPAGPADPEVLLHIGIQRAADARREAVEKMDSGDMPGAMRALETRRDELRSMAAQTSAPDRLGTEASELDRRAKEIREEQDLRDARKFMVAEGTQLSQTDFCGTQSARQRRTRPRGQTGGAAGTT